MVCKCQDDNTVCCQLDMFYHICTGDHVKVYTWYGITPFSETLLNQLPDITCAVASQVIFSPFVEHQNPAGLDSSCLAQAVLKNIRKGCKVNQMEDIHFGQWLVHCEAYMSVHCDIISNWLMHILSIVEVAKEDFLKRKHCLVYHICLCNFQAVLRLMASALLYSTLSACTLVVHR